MDLVKSNLCPQNVDISTIYSENAITHIHSSISLYSEDYCSSTSSISSSSLDSLCSTSSSETSLPPVKESSSQRCLQGSFKQSLNHLNSVNVPHETSKCQQEKMEASRVCQPPTTNGHLKKEHCNDNQSVEKLITQKSQSYSNADSDRLKVSSNGVSNCKGTFVPNGTATKDEHCTWMMHKKSNGHVTPCTKVLVGQQMDESRNCQEKQIVRSPVTCYDKMNLSPKLPN